MFKNLILLGLLSWVSFSYARPDDFAVAHDTITDAESYKVEKPVTEQEAQRSVAGAKIKKKKAQTGDGASKDEVTGPADSEVRYWQYSE